MTTSLAYTWSYDAPIDAVRTMIFDPTFREQVCEAQHATSRTVRIEGREVEIDYAQATDRVPSYAKKMVGDSIAVSQREQWTGDEAAVEILIPGKPGRAHGRVSLIDAGGTTTQSVVLEVTAKVPLVGGKLESMIKDLLLKAFEREARVGQQWLQES
jgi:hypothetical protein